MTRCKVGASRGLETSPEPRVYDSEAVSRSVRPVDVSYARHTASTSPPLRGALVRAVVCESLRKRARVEETCMRPRMQQESKDSSRIEDPPRRRMPGFQTPRYQLRRAPAAPTFVALLFLNVLERLPTTCTERTDLASVPHLDNSPCRRHCLAVDESLIPLDTPA